MVKSLLFDATLPDDNIHACGEPGPIKVVSDGYWVLLRRLQPGEHTLIISQSTKDHPPSGTLNCKYDVIYHLTVQ
jgi:hypothetical protein